MIFKTTGRVHHLGLGHHTKNLLAIPLVDMCNATWHVIVNGATIEGADGTPFTDVATQIARFVHHVHTNGRANGN